MIRKIFFLFVILTHLIIIFGQNKIGDENDEEYSPNESAVQSTGFDNSVLNELRIPEQTDEMQQVFLQQIATSQSKSMHLPRLFTGFALSLFGNFLKNMSKGEKKDHADLCPGPSVEGISRYKNLFNDQFFHEQWYLHDCRRNGNEIRYDLNVVRVWIEKQRLGRGIRVAVVDFGCDKSYPDLRINYDSEHSEIFGKKNIIDRIFSMHGTSIACIIAMQANNKIGGVGIAPLATVAGLTAIYTFKDDDVMDTIISNAFLYQLDNVDISNNSWALERICKKTPDLTHKFPKILASIKKGINEGRQFKGIIFIFSCGNGKGTNNNVCAYNFLVKSIYTIVVAAVEYNGSPTKYSQQCSSILVTAFGSNIITMNKFCKRKEGTSMAAAIVSGIVALILEANPELTWREVQHVLVWTSQVAPMTAKYKQWFRNRAGFYFSQDFGFGLVDAYSAVTFAESMKHIPPMNSCIVPIKVMNNMSFRRSSSLHITFSTNGCKDLPSEVNYIEHVQLLTSVKYPKRGAINIVLKSPSGTQTLLLDSRIGDNSSSGLSKFVADTVHLWGESPLGEWSLFFCDKISAKEYKGEVTELFLLIHGTKDKPLHYVTKRSYKRFSP